MSKKLISVAAAAALALTGLVAIPANANAFDVAVNASATAPTDSTNTGASATNAVGIMVPTSNVIRSGANANGANTTGTALRLVATKSAASAVVTATATGSVLLYSTASLADTPTVAGGVKSLTFTNTDASVTLFAATTSTANGTVVVSDSNGSSETIHIKGISTMPYKLVLTAPATAPLSGEFAITGKVQDAFGNDLTTALDISTGFTINTVGATAVAGATKTFYSSTARTYTWTFTAPAVATGTAVSVAIAPSFAPTAVTAFGTPVSSQFFTVSAVNLAAQVTALEAQVASLKADYNALAERWNKRVASKKAPKKAVTLK
jgi:trimeric autotransporter adhesin